jgi:hypothetical protein
MASEYILKFKVNPAVDDVFIECKSFDAAVSEITENVNELEWAREIPGDRDVTRNLIAEFNFRQDNPDWEDREEEKARRELADRRSAYYSQVM